MVLMVCGLGIALVIVLFVVAFFFHRRQVRL